MASSISLLRFPGKDLFSGNHLRQLRPLRVAPLGKVSFRTSAQKAMRFDDDDRTTSGFFSVFPIVKNATVYPSVPLSRTGEKEEKGRGYHLREDEEALYVKIDMPGLGKEDVKVLVKDNALIIRGEQANKEETTEDEEEETEDEDEETEDEEEETEDEDDDDQESGSRYSKWIFLAPNSYKYDEIKAEMKNGVLNVIVPVLKEEERKDIIRVQVN